MRTEIVKQYVSTLKEDDELDYIFPLLLERMGYRLLSTPRQSKGQPQYGRDVVALKEYDGQMTLWLFELKGFRAKDVTDRTLNEPDGIIESLNASRYTKYRDASLPGLSEYPRRYVFVHNGTVDANALITLNDYVEAAFPDKNFERWDLFKLTGLFSEYLFDETLLTDEESYRLFKKVLALLDSEGNDFSDIVKLIDLQIERLGSSGKGTSRNMLNCFATLRLIASMVYYYAQGEGNLYPAKYCIDTMLLKVWAWILRSKSESSKKIVGYYNSLVLFQLKVYEEYLNKILKYARMPKGLYSFTPSDTEYVLYPLRCFDFLGDLIYFYYATEAYAEINDEERENRIEILKQIISNNNACAMPLLDTHSIPLLMVFKYVLSHTRSKADIQFLCDYLSDVIVNMTHRYSWQHMWPEMSGNRMVLARSLYDKSDDYGSDSSLFIITVFELIAYFGIDFLYDHLKTRVESSGVNLQVSYPIADRYDIEQLLFEHRLYEEMSVQTCIELPPTLTEFKAAFRKPYNTLDFRTNKANYGFMILLAHKYYETDFFPDFLGREFCSEISG